MPEQVSSRSPGAFKSLSYTLTLSHTEKKC